MIWYENGVALSSSGFITARIEGSTLNSNQYKAYIKTTVSNMTNGYVADKGIVPISLQDVIELNVLELDTEESLYQYEGITLDKKYVFDQINDDAQQKINSINQMYNYNDNKSMEKYLKETAILLEKAVQDTDYKLYAKAIERIILLNDSINIKRSTS
jgi:hypothetical protein